MSKSLCYFLNFPSVGNIALSIESGTPGVLLGDNITSSWIPFPELRLCGSNVEFASLWLTERKSQRWQEGFIGLNWFYGGLALKAGEKLAGSRRFRYRNYESI